MVTTGPGLASAVESASGEACVAVDLESNGFYHYPERVCLVQLAIRDEVYIIDPLSVGDVSPLGELLANGAIEKVFHSADYDVRSLSREWGFGVRGLFDTGIAAAFAGSERLGLDAVLREYLGVEVVKEKRLQRADWTRRPLSAEMVRYAAGDVRHLVRLRLLLADRLALLGRAEWVREEFERLAGVRYSEPDADWGFLRVRGSGALDGRGLAVLRSLFEFREGEARRRDRPPFKVFSDAAMVALASEPSSDLADVKGLGRYGRAPASRGVRRAIREGVGSPPLRRPRRSPTGRRRLSREEREEARVRLRLLKEWRQGHAVRLGLEPSLVWPAASLERLSVGGDGFDEAAVVEESRLWQRLEFGDSLRGFVEGLRPPCG